MCRFISGFSILFHLSIFLILCQHRTVLIAVGHVIMAIIKRTQITNAGEDVENSMEISQKNTNRTAI